jgi:nucleoside-diphosphate-sugar epimerase
MNSAGGHDVVVTGGLGFIGSHVVDALLPQAIAWSSSTPWNAGPDRAVHRP